MKKNRIRIIGGQWKNKRIPILKKIKTLRPTLERIRETLFNWLSPYIIEASCLDCFAGSGALSIEALSRQANFVTLLEYNSKVINHLKNIFKKMDIKRGKIIHTNTISWLKIYKKKFNIIFIDPPFDNFFF